MISKSLSTSERRAALHDEAGKLAEFCQALYPLLLAHADDWGCQQGDVFTIKHLVDPTSPRRLTDFDAALAALHNVGLIAWYQDDAGKWIVYISGWFAHQQLKGHDRDGRTRTFQAPPENTNKIGKVAQSCPTAPKTALREQKRTELKGTEGNRTEPAMQGFADFWGVYPKRIARADAEKAWKSIAAPVPELSVVIAAVVAQANSHDWQKERGKYVPYPASWIRARRWEDEPADVPGDRPHWSEECAELHGGTCEKRWDHENRILDERGAA